MSEDFIFQTSSKVLSHAFEIIGEILRDLQAPYVLEVWIKLDKLLCGMNVAS
jgi:hypothetical protein